MSAKWPGLPAFLAHLAIGACLAMPVNTFVQYYFNGRLMAQLPQWDASIYSHAAIMPVYVLGEPITALLCTTEPFTVSNDGYLELKNPTTAILATGVIANRVHVRWKWLEGTNDYEAGVWNTSAAAVIWSNYDLVDAAGNVYLKASEPVPRAPIPVLPDPEPDPERKPIAYKYNGVQLPDINTVWTNEIKQTYTNALIFREADGTYTARFYTDAAHYMLLGGRVCYGSYVMSKSPYLSSVYTNDESGWSTLTEVEYGGRVIDGTNSDGYRLLWASFNVEYEGTVYLATSEPVPVYE